jgi:hypothetical protein
LPSGGGDAIVIRGRQWPGNMVPGPVRQMALSEDEERAFAEELERLRQEHRDLDTAIEALAALVVADRLQLQRLKKRKLALRDRIAYLDDMLTPDIIA